MGEKVLLEKNNGVAIITINKPDALNALDLEMREDLKNIFQDMAKDAAIGALIIAGNGRAFCAGGDITTMGDLKPNDGRKRIKNIQLAIKTIMEMEKPVIAAVHGYATGAGMNLALACDFIIAADNAKFCQSFTKIGLVPDCGGFYTLPRKVGLAKAKELMMLAPTMDAQTALSMGLINKVAPAEQLMQEAMEMASKLAQGPKIALGLCKSILNASYETDLDASFEFEAYAQDLCMQTEDFQEGIAAFKEKRKPAFQGR